MKKGNYKKFLIMLIVSFFIMYMVMFLNVVRFDHIYLSATRFYMALLMVSPMALLMLLFMPNMYQNKKRNLFIASLSVLVFFIAFIFLRNQILIGDTQYTKAMISHHSSAILTSREANLTDPELKVLAEDIIKAQEGEIAQMKEILKRLGE